MENSCCTWYQIELKNSSNHLNMYIVLINKICGFMAYFMHGPQGEVLHVLFDENLHCANDEELDGPQDENMHVPQSEEIHGPLCEDMHGPQCEKLHGPQGEELHGLQGLKQVIMALFFSSDEVRR